MFSNVYTVVYIYIAYSCIYIYIIHISTIIYIYTYNSKNIYTYIDIFIYICVLIKWASAQVPPTPLIGGGVL